MVEAIVHEHKAPPCGDGRHHAGCNMKPGWTEDCEQFGDWCICIHWPPPGELDMVDGKPKVKFVQSRE